MGDERKSHEHLAWKIPLENILNSMWLKGDDDFLKINPTTEPTPFHVCQILHTRESDGDDEEAKITT